MDKRKISKIIEALRKIGCDRDADVLEKSVNGDYDSSYFGVKISQKLIHQCAWCKRIRGDDGEWMPYEDMIGDATHSVCHDCMETIIKPQIEKLRSERAENIRSAQLEDTPFVPVRKKLTGYDAQLDKEKAWLRSRLPLSRQQGEKLTKMPQVESELSGLGGKEALEFGYPYRDPASINRVSDPDAMIERIKKHGWPPHGLNTQFGKVLDVDPKHPVLEVGPRGGKTYGEEFDFGEGAGIGYIPEGSDEFMYSQQEDLDPEFADMIKRIWGEGVGQFTINVQSAMDRFNKRLESWMTNGQNQMLSTNFMTQMNQVIAGNSHANSVWETDINGESLVAVIIQRMQNVQSIRDNMIRSSDESGQYAELQYDLFTKYLDDLRIGKDYPSEMWLNKLMLVYGQNPKQSGSSNYIMDNIVENTFEIQYPQSFIENVVLPYKETKRKIGSGGGERERKELNWSDILSRNFQPLTTGAEETAKRRKMIEDVDIWKGLMSGGEEGKPLITSQKDVIIFQYNKELMHLLELLNDLQRMLSLKQRFTSSKLEDATSNPTAMSEMDKAVLKFARTLEQHYRQGELATAEGKLIGNYSVGSETKLEIYIKALYILQAYEAWSERLSSYPVETVTGNEEPQILSDIERIEADESMIPRSAFSYQDMVKIANALDSYGLYDLVDKLDRQYNN